MDIGIITKIDEKCMLVMANMGIQKVKPRNNAYIGMKIEYSRKDIYIGFDRLEIRYVIVAMIVISLILFSTIILNAGDSENAYAVVSIDINPSLELYIDNNYNVIGYHTYNDDAKKILNSDIISLNILEALQVVVISAQEHNYLSKDDFILLSLGINHKVTEDTFIEDLVKGFAVDNQEKYKFVYVNGTNKLQYRDQSISLGRQQVATISGLVISKAKEIAVSSLVLQTIQGDRIDYMKSFEIGIDDQGVGKAKVIMTDEQNVDDVVNEAEPSRDIYDKHEVDEIDFEKNSIVDRKEKEIETKKETKMEEKEESKETKMEEKEESKEAKIDETEESKETKIDEKEESKETKIEEKEEPEETKIDEKEESKEAKIDETEESKETKIEEKEESKETKIEEKEESKETKIDEKDQDKEEKVEDQETENDKDDKVELEDKDKDKDNE